MSTRWDAVLPVLHARILHFFKPVNDQKLSIFETSSGNSFTAVSIFKTIDHEVEKDHDERENIKESSISEIELIKQHI